MVNLFQYKTGDRAKINRQTKTEMATGQTNISKTFGRHDSQRKEVLFFAYPHFLFFNFFATAHCTHLPLLVYAQTNPTQKQSQKSAIPSIHFYLIKR
jgi:hypothetical protein